MTQITRVCGSTARRCTACTHRLRCTPCRIDETSPYPRSFRKIYHSHRPRFSPDCARCLPPPRATRIDYEETRGIEIRCARCVQRERSASRRGPEGRRNYSSIFRWEIVARWHDTCSITRRSFVPAADRQRARTCTLKTREITKNYPSRRPNPCYDDAEELDNTPKVVCSRACVYARISTYT